MPSNTNIQMNTAINTPNAKQLVLYHHDPYRSDEYMAAIEKEAQSVFPNTIAAKQGHTIKI